MVSPIRQWDCLRRFLASSSLCLGLWALHGGRRVTVRRMNGETLRLLLRPIADDDLDAFVEFVSDPEATRLTHVPVPIADLEEAAGVLQRWATLYDDPIGMYSVRVAETGETAGFAGFSRREMPWGDEVELGWLLRPACWSRGYATEAARFLRPLVPGRVISLIRVENIASANVARKLGMRIERDVDFRGFETHVWVAADGSSHAPE